MEDKVRGTVRFLMAAAIPAAGGYAGYLWFDSIARDWHSALLGGSAALVAMAVTVGFQVAGKLDKVLESADKFEIDSYISPVYSYVSAIRHRFVYSLLVAASGGVLNTAIAVAIRKPHATTWFMARDLTALGYAALTFIVLFTLRVVGLYLQVDEFRRRTVEAVTLERKRATTLLELKRPIVQSIPDRAASTAGNVG